MLVLTRKAGEVIICKTPSGEVIEFMIVEQIANRVRVGVTAKKDVMIHRKEIYEENQRAGRTNDHRVRDAGHGGQGRGPGATRAVQDDG